MPNRPDPIPVELLSLSRREALNLAARATLTTLLPGLAQGYASVGQATANQGATETQEQRKTELIKDVDSKMPRLMPQLGHSHRVTSAVFSSDSKYVLTASSDKTARLWDVETGMEIQVFKGHSHKVTSAEFSPDGKCILTASWDGTARLWDIETGKEIYIFKVYSGFIYSAKYSPDAKSVLTANEESTSMLWDVATGKLIHIFRHSQSVYSAVFSTDGKYVLTASIDHTARLWNTQTGKEIHIFIGHLSIIYSAVFSPDGKYVLTASEDNTARLWDVATGKQIQALDHSRVYSAMYSPGGKIILTASYDNTARIWDVTTGKEIQAFKGYSRFSPDGRSILTASSDNVVRLWNIQTGKEIDILTGYTDSIGSVEFSPDGRSILTASSDNVVRLWNIQTGKKIHILTGHSDSVGSVKFSDSGNTLLLMSKSNSARLWNIPPGQTIRVLTGHSVGTCSAVFSPDEKYILTASHDNTARLWDVATGKEAQIFKGHLNTVHSAMVSPDGKNALTASHDNTARLWDVKTGQIVHIFNGHSREVFFAVFSPDGKWVLTASEDDDARLWDVQTGQVIHVFGGHSDIFYSAGFSLDGTCILTASGDTTARLWDVATGKLIHIFRHSDSVYSAVFSPDGKYVLTASKDNTAILWDTATGKALKIFRGHSDSVYAAIFSPDGKYVLTASDDNTAILWDTATGKALKIFRGHSDSVYAAIFSPDGKYVLTASDDNTARLWDTATGKELCSLLSFSDDTWAVTDPVGRFDASNDGNIEGLHWVLGLEPIDLYQLRERYYTPGLLAKIMGYDKTPLKPVGEFTLSKTLFPEVEATLTTPTQLQVTLTPRSGGLGKVQVFVNGVLFQELAKPPATTFTVDLTEAPTRRRDGDNEVQVVAFHAENWFSSRRIVARGPGERGLLLGSPRPAPANVDATRRLFAVVVGISEYGSPKLRLKYPTLDANAIAFALERGGQRFFTASRTHITTLTSDSPPERQPTKANLKAVFEQIAQQKPTADDILVIYLAGHGVSLPLNNGLYAYLTQEATSFDTATLAADSALRQATCLTNDELEGYFNRIGAAYRVMILDTCAAGAAVASEKRNIPDDQLLAMTRFKDRTGFHILMGCAANQSSYEASKYQHGLLTYALLQGMKGAALREGEWVDIHKLFGYVENAVVPLASGIGGIQQPRYQKSAAGSFDIGRLLADDRTAIPLSPPVPQILRPSLSNQADGVDDLELSALLRNTLNRLTQPTARLVAATSAPLAAVFLDEDALAGGYRPQGNYQVSGKSITVHLTLLRDKARVGSLTLNGTTDALPTLTDQLARAVIRLAQDAEKSPRTQKDKKP